MEGGAGKAAKDPPRQGMTARPERWAIWRPINSLQLSPTWPPKPFPAVSFPNREPRHSLSPRCLQTVSRLSPDRFLITTGQLIARTVVIHLG